MNSVYLLLDFTIIGHAFASTVANRPKWGGVEMFRKNRIKFNHDEIFLYPCYLLFVCHKVFGRRCESDDL